MQVVSEFTWFDFSGIADVDPTERPSDGPPLSFNASHQLPLYLFFRHDLPLLAIHLLPFVLFFHIVFEFGINLRVMTESQTRSVPDCRPNPPAEFKVVKFAGAVSAVVLE
jgi:hypothetical protein